MPRTGQRAPAAGLPAAPPAGRAPARTRLLLALLGAGLLVPATAAPALAAQDPTRPRATVTRGPSCAPGGLELQVQAGTVAVHAVLATTRKPEGEDATDLPAGGTAVLRTGEVAWGETVDSRLVSTPADGSGGTWVDELDDWTLTRPTEADCAVAAGTAPAAPVAGPDEDAPAAPAAPDAGAPDPVPGDPTTAPGPGAPDPVGPAPAGAATQPSAVVTDGAAGSDGASSRAVGAGRPITVTARGFLPGEPVTVRVGSSGVVLARGSAGPDGTVALRLTVPARAAGSTGLALAGASSGTAARLELQVAALAAPAREGGPLALPPLAALASLIATGGLLVPVARRSAGVRRGAGPGGGGAAVGGGWSGAPVGARDGARPPR